MRLVTVEIVFHDDFDTISCWNSTIMLSMFYL